jgi:hypothetical protein
MPVPMKKPRTTTAELRMIGPVKNMGKAKKALSKQGYTVGRVEQFLGLTQTESEITDSILYSPAN